MSIPTIILQPILRKIDHAKRYILWKGAALFVDAAFLEIDRRIVNKQQ